MSALKSVPEVDMSKKLAEDYIKAYFINRNLYSGGKIPKAVLSDKNYISVVLNTFSISYGIFKAHKMMGFDKVEVQPFKRKGTILPSSEMILTVLKACAKLSIPKCFAAGILLIHLELCEGYTMIWQDLTDEMEKENEG